MRIQIQNRQGRIRIHPKLMLSLWKVLRMTERRFGIPPEAEVSLLITDDQHICRLNRRYRGIRKPTDVLSFSMNEGERLVSGIAGPVLGDIIISAERALTQAHAYGHGLTREMAFLTAHGMLHLLGYDHQEPKAAAGMERLQEEILRGAGIKGRTGYCGSRGGRQNAASTCGAQRLDEILRF
jgi:probable rRNA maturation factor